MKAHTNAHAHAHTHTHTPYTCKIHMQAHAQAHTRTCMHAHPQIYRVHELIFHFTVNIYNSAFTLQKRGAPPLSWVPFHGYLSSLVTPGLFSRERQGPAVYTSSLCHKAEVWVKGKDRNMDTANPLIGDLPSVSNGSAENRPRLPDRPIKASGDA